MSHSLAKPKVATENTSLGHDDPARLWFAKETSQLGWEEASRHHVRRVGHCSSSERWAFRSGTRRL